MVITSFAFVPSASAHTINNSEFENLWWGIARNTEEVTIISDNEDSFVVVIAYSPSPTEKWGFMEIYPAEDNDIGDTFLLDYSPEPWVTGVVSADGLSAEITIYSATGGYGYNIVGEDSFTDITFTANFW
ncbi:hypothetical protein FUAX_39340 (plasmid) [Fulvitalea axinellae]|uniref:Uncharacterized protein n=1 Tax=Fulvitalea axinellae TaxID=1182444 RepID=A0AAU9CU43_9BACT|nr:hypothetical protein FUAX_39340 [Fulvitalea axinellae]